MQESERETGLLESDSILFVVVVVRCFIRECVNVKPVKSENKKNMDISRRNPRKKKIIVINRVEERKKQRGGGLLKQKLMARFTMHCWIPSSRQLRAALNSEKGGLSEGESSKVSNFFFEPHRSTQHVILERRHQKKSVVVFSL